MHDTISGNGNILANVVNYGGAFSPGFSPGEINIDGALTMYDGIMNFEIGGTSSGLFDVLNVSGPVNIFGGDIVSSFIDGFIPELGDSFEFLISPEIFIDPLVEFTFFGLPDYYGFDYSSSGMLMTVDVESVPEPKVVYLLIVGLIYIWCFLDENH
ncbi:hypothetical protein [Emcibacter nanhaiensis]|uniref:PEP-CTERM sorting domain-containing protein n=1 Tax=Emcibacter nanhaiensis TaxID=1505037 RepID=A0A501PJD6_9PROT|nr:hypothetical protein [Emcibacter nanhaiensis]TPD60237.1 hypothetical protein FIV46_09300 [Emcibacter nanhaiensis]